ncbi:hypothetical protein ACFOSD_03505 [Salinispirillum marinum]|uniref:Uncharacterized protein n=2 Tax=Saccharospirillaceae TaxID=255527 RepID=A0ABV8BB84_9GAMM
MVGVTAGAGFTNNLTLTRNAERSAEQAEQRAEALQRESQRLKQEADRTQQTADVLYTRSDESRQEARSLLSEADSSQASVDPRRAFDIPNPLRVTRAETTESDERQVPVRVVSDASSDTTTAGSPNPYATTAGTEPGTLISERV